MANEAAGTDSASNADVTTNADTVVVDGAQNEAAGLNNVEEEK